MKIPSRAALLTTGALVTTATGGYLTSMAVSANGQSATKTVTINVGTGETGPTGPQGPPGQTGPQGPKGDTGGVKCPTGFVEGVLVINHPGGQTKIFTCLEQ